MSNIQKLWHIFEIYCINTNLHGFAYIVQSARHKVERIFWSLLIFVSLILTGILIHKLVIYSHKNPIVIYTDQNVVHIQDLNFPSVSVCPGVITKSPYRVLLDYDLITLHSTANVFNIDVLSENQLKLMQIASLIARDGLIGRHYTRLPIKTHDFVEKLRSFELPWMTSFSEFRNETVSFFEVVWLKNFYGNLTQTLWKQGFCYTFNFPGPEKMFHITKMSKDFIYEDFSPTAELMRFSQLNSTPPYKSPLPGSGLSIRYNERSFFISYGEKVPNYSHQTYRPFQILDHTIPKSPFGGHRLIFHDSFEVIPHNAEIIHSTPDSTMKILVTPTIRRIDESLMDSDPEQRNCYLLDERKLKFLKVYNRVNCEHECLAEMTLNFCQCVQFFMVRGRSTKICGFKDEKCYIEVEGKFERLKHRCKCFENCELLKYDIQVAFKQKNVHKKMDPHFQVTSGIIVEMSSQVIMAMSRKQSSTIIDLLSLSGGFLGLFAGFSVLSAAEIVYYFLISPILIYRARNSTRVHPVQIEEERKIENRALEYVKQTLQESSIHSVNHIGNDQKSIFERSVWSLLLIASMTCTYFMVKQVYRRTDSNIVSITMEGMTSVNEIPFPAITFQGSLNKFYSSIVYDSYNLWKHLGHKNNNTMLDFLEETKKENDPDEDMQQLQALICGDALATYSENEDFKMHSVVEGYRKWLYYSGQENWFAHHTATWNSRIAAELTKIVSKFGYSYAFNMLNASELLTASVSEDFSYAYNSSVGYPWKTGASEKRGLTLIHLNRHIVFVCVKSSVAIHSPYEFPDDFFTVDDKNEYQINIIPSIMKASDDLKSLPVAARRCFFDDERQLKFFKIYTQKNCEFECTAFELQKRCKCVPFYYIREATWELCEYKRMKFCVEPFFYQRSIKSANESDNCNCLPACNSISYGFEIIDHALKKYQITSAGDMRTIRMRPLLMEFHYKDSEYFTFMRYQEFDFVDFLSYVGGILGLFAGISTLSCVEVIYFITLRLATDLRRYFWACFSDSSRPH